MEQSRRNEVMVTQSEVGYRFARLEPIEEIPKASNVRPQQFSEQRIDCLVSELGRHDDVLVVRTNDGGFFFPQRVYGYRWDQRQRIREGFRDYVQETNDFNTITLTRENNRVGLRVVDDEVIIPHASGTPLFDPEEWV